MEQFFERLEKIRRAAGLPLRPMKYTARVERIREISVEAETIERAQRLLQRRLEPGEKILTTQISLL